MGKSTIYKSPFSIANCQSLPEGTNHAQDPAVTMKNPLEQPPPPSQGPGGRRAETTAAATVGPWPVQRREETSAGRDSGASGAHFFLAK